MDLDLSFISAVLRADKGFYISKRASISATMLQGEVAVHGWNFIEDHVLEFGAVPSPDFFSAKTGIQLIDVSEDLLVLIKDIKERSLWIELRAGHERAGEFLEKRKSKDALDVFQKTVTKAYKDRVAGGRVDSLMSLGGDVLEYYNRMKNGDRGVLSPWDAMNQSTLGWWGGDFIVFVARMGIGKCVKFDTEIPDPVTGVYRTIEEIVKNKSAVFTRDRYGSYFPVMPDMHVATGRKECLRVTTRSGLAIAATPEHPFSVVGGWKRADDLAVGDYVETVKYMPEPIEARDDILVEEVQLVAALLADGGLTTYSPIFSKMDAKILGVVRSACNLLGADLVKHKGMNESTWAISDFSKHGKNVVRDMLSRWGIGRDKSIHKTIPDCVFSLSNRLLSVFIGMLWSCDGSVESKGCLTISFGSKRLVYQVKRLLLRFGITGRIRARKTLCNGRTFDSWEFRVHSTCYGLFKRNIVLVGEKAERLLSIEDGTNPNVDTIPMNDWLIERINRVVDDGMKCGIKISDVGKVLGWSSWFSKRVLFQNKTISKRYLAAFCEVFHDEELLSLCDPHWDEVVSVESVGVHDVYDLTVMGTHCFVANDIVAHNTFVMLMLARQAWLSGKRVLFVGTEMNRIKLAIRFYAIHLKLSYQELRVGELGEFNEKKLIEGVNDLMGQDGLYIVGDDFDASLDEIEAAVDEVKPHLVLVDGIYLVKNEGRDRHTRVSNNADDLKRMAKRRDIPIIASSQFNREVDSNSKAKVSAENIGITDVIGWNADVIYGMYQTDDMKEDRLMGFRPMKLREGTGEDFFTRWRFDDMDFEQDDDQNAGASGDYEYKGVSGIVDISDADDEWGDDDGGGTLF